MHGQDLGLCPVKPKVNIFNSKSLCWNDCACFESQIRKTKLIPNDLPVFTGNTKLFVDNFTNVLFPGVYKRYSYGRVLSSYSGKKLKRYKNALKSLKSVGLKPSDFDIRAFMKVEKNILHEKNPRLIQHQGYKCLLENMTFIKPLEEQIWKYQYGGYKVFVKNMNGRQRGELIHSLFTKYRRAICVDIKSFDVNVKPY